MAHGYTFQREGDGYRFFPDAVDTGGGTATGNPFMRGNGPIWLAVVALLLAFAVREPIAMLIGIGGAGWLLYTKFIAGPRQAPPVSVGSTAPTGGILVTPEAIVTETGERIPAARLNSIDVKNEYDAYFAGQGGSRTYYKAGSGMAALDAIGHERKTKASATCYFVTVQHGPTETVLAKKLSENGATGLRADIDRVLRGQSLD